MDKTEANKLAWSYWSIAQRYISAANQVIKVAAEIQPDQDDTELLNLFISRLTLKSLIFMLKKKGA